MKKALLVSLDSKYLVDEILLKLISLNNMDISRAEFLNDFNRLTEKAREYIERSNLGDIGDCISIADFVNQNHNNIGIANSVLERSRDKNGYINNMVEYLDEKEALDRKYEEVFSCFTSKVELVEVDHEDWLPDVEYLPL